MSTDGTNPQRSHSGAWYLAPIFIGILGGLVMYIVIKDDDPKMAKKGLIVGLILTAVDTIIFIPLLVLTPFLFI